jgi:hypothetical protein
VVQTVVLVDPVAQQAEAAAEAAQLLLHQLLLPVELEQLQITQVALLFTELVAQVAPHKAQDQIFQVLQRVQILETVEAVHLLKTQVAMLMVVLAELD